MTLGRFLGSFWFYPLGFTLHGDPDEGQVKKSKGSCCSLSAELKPRVMRKRNHVAVLESESRCKQNISTHGEAKKL